MTPRSMVDAVTDLTRDPRPVLFLDTCDLVNLLQVGATVPMEELLAATRLLKALDESPPRCQPVVTFVTATEYAQKTDPADPVYAADSITSGATLPPEAMRRFLAALDEQLDKLHQIRDILQRPLPPPTPYAGLNLVGDLKEVADQLLARCVVLQREAACVDAAVGRVFSKTRPSHKREVKDSIHLEHCLEFASRLRAAGFAPAIVFVSANKNDYGPSSHARPHADLRASFVAVNMAYFDGLNYALPYLQI